MYKLKRPVILCLAVGAGIASVVLIVGGIFFLRSSRPVAVKPWDTQSIKAYYDYITIDSSDNVVFRYTLENETGSDYEAMTKDDLRIFGKIQSESSLWSTDLLQFDIPIFLPSKQRMAFSISFRIPGDDAEKYRKRAASFVNEKLGNLNGFIIYDKNHHYQIDFPNGWATSTVNSEN